MQHGVNIDVVGIGVEQACAAVALISHPDVLHVVYRFVCAGVARRLAYEVARANAKREELSKGNTLSSIAMSQQAFESGLYDG